MSVSVKILCLVLFLAAGLQAQDIPEDLVELKRRHFQRRDAVMSVYEVNKAKLASQYYGALKSKEKAAQSAGDLNALLAVREELTRFREEKSWLRNVPESAHAKIKSLMQIGYKQIREHQERRDNDLQRLNAAYRKDLDTLMKRMTIGDRIDDAKVVRTELTEVSNGRPGFDLPAEEEPEVAETDQAEAASTGSATPTSSTTKRPVAFSIDRWIGALDASEQSKPVYQELRESVKSLDALFASEDLETQQDGLTQAMLTIDRAARTENGKQLAWKLCERYLVPNINLASADPDAFTSRASLKEYVAEVKAAAGQD